jgi:3-hydroxy acid dehydrogenase / malonic semialdehyde reductase
MLMLVDATVLITGASSGIGRACAVAFAQAGARLVLCARRHDRLESLRTALEATHGTQTLTIELDVRDRTAVERALATLPAPFADVDVLVNNAGLAAGLAPLQEGDPDDWELMVDTNVKGLLWITRTVVPRMAARGRGHVINIGSIAGRETYPGGAVYCASKAAVDRITAGLRMDLLGTGVKVSTVDPGMVDTEFSLVRFHGDAERAHDVYAGMVPLTAEDIAETVVWVADRPAHVQVADVVIFPTAQASATRVARDA